MIEKSRQFYQIMKLLYDKTSVEINLPFTFNEMMESNSSRLEFINKLFANINYGNVSSELADTFSASIEYIHRFMNGEDVRTLEVPQKYFEDMDDCVLSPSKADLETLFAYIDTIKIVYQSYYEGQDIVIKLPGETFNQNMIKIISIEKRQLAHLLGLTEHESKDNYLKKFFIESDMEEHPEYYDENGTYIHNEHISSRMLDWITSKKGKQQLLSINELTNLFIEKDKEKYPDAYSNGRLKPDSLPKFRERFKKQTTFDYPIIKFSRYLVKSINLLNFLNMSNICEAISDYNAPLGEKNEKDLFLVNANQEALRNDILNYNMYEYSYLKKLREYAVVSEETRKEKIAEFFKKQGIDIERILKNEMRKYEEMKRKGYQDDSLEHDTLTRFLNQTYTHDYTLKHGIKPKYSNVRAMIRDNISSMFKRNVSLVGFGTDYDEITGIKEISIKRSHTDTAISVKPSDLVGKYYVRGRNFFLDKVGTDASILRISNPKEEAAFLEKMKHVDAMLEEEEINLREKRDSFEKMYYADKLKRALFEEYLKLSRIKGLATIMQIKEQFEENYRLYQEKKKHL